MNSEGSYEAKNNTLLQRLCEIFDRLFQTCVELDRWLPA